MSESPLGGASSDTFRLRDTARLRQCLDADFSRLRTVAHAADLAANVPSCPGWSMADLLTHVAAVYLDKVACMRLGRDPGQWPPAGIESEAPLASLDRAFEALTTEFTVRDPRAATYTWCEPEQTVEFWIRRMTQETVIHRMDAELAAGVEVADIPADLAVDGIDEVLTVFIDYASHAWREGFQAELTAAHGLTVRVRTTGAQWLIKVRDDGVTVERSHPGGPDDTVLAATATISGEPSDVLLWLWSRASDDEVYLHGDAEALVALRGILVVGTQ